MRHPVVVSSLTEDLRAIGLLSEEGEETPAPDPDVDGGYSAEPGSDEVKPQAESDDEDEDDVAVTETDDSDDDDQDGEDTMEAARGYVASVARNFLKAHTPASRSRFESRRAPKKRLVAESKARPSKAPLRTQKESKNLRMRRLAAGRIFESAPAKKTHAVAAPSRAARVASLLNEVSELTNGIHRAKRAEHIQGFANIALISEMLSRRFKSISMEFAEGNLFKVSGAMTRLSEQASDVAIALDAPPEDDETPVDDGAMEAEDPMGGADDAQVDGLFKKLMAKLLDALQLYNDVTGKEEGDDVDLDPSDDELDDDDDLPPLPPGTDEEEGDDMLPGDDKQPMDLEGDDEFDPEVDADGTDDEIDDVDDEEDPTAEADENPFAKKDDDDDDKAVSEGKKALRRVLNQAKRGKGKKRLTAAKKKMTVAKKRKR